MTRPYAILQVMGVRLYRDPPALASFTKTLVRHHVEQGGLTVVGDLRTAYSFGQLVHADDCQLGDGECSEGCAILPCDEADASVVMMRVEFQTENGESDHA